MNGHSHTIIFQLSSIYCTVTSLHPGSEGREPPGEPGLKRGFLPGKNGKWAGFDDSEIKDPMLAGLSGLRGGVNDSGTSFWR
jgi:hypothetical protein